MTIRQLRVDNGDVVQAPGERKAIISAIVIVVILRLFTLGCPPFLDRTEARAALISKIVLETGQPFVLQSPIEGVLTPYWAKPPLHYWIGAIGQALFGSGEVGARIPGFVGYLATLVLTFAFGRKFFAEDTALRAVLVLASTPLFNVISGLALPDNTFLCFITSAIVLSYFSLVERSLVGGIVQAGLGGASLALSVLTKGPVGLILTWIPLLVWTLLQDKRPKDLLVKAVAHLLAILIITVPVFTQLEIQNPGYLKYMILKENIGRYLQPDSIVTFGSVHRLYFGLGVIYGVVGFLPWSISLFRLSWFKGLIKERNSNKEFLVYCAFWPMIFFSFTRSALGTYILPSLPFLSLLFAQMLTVVKPNDGALLRVGVLLCTIGSFAFGMSADLDREHTTYAVLLIATLAMCGLIGERKRTLPRFAVCLAIVLAISTVSLNAYLSDRFSTKHVLAAIDESHVAGLRAFTWETPYSAYMYDSALFRNLLVQRNASTSNLNVSDEEVQAKTCDSAVVSKKKDLHLLKKSPEASQLHRHGKWLWIENGCELLPR